MVELYEKGHQFENRLMRAPSTDFENKAVMNTGGEHFEIVDAFEVMMASGGTPKRTPRTVKMKAKRKSVKTPVRKQGKEKI